MRSTLPAAPCCGCEAVRRDLDALRADVDALRAELRPRQPHDPTRDMALLSAIALAFGGSVFTAGDIVAHGSVELRGLVGDLSVRQVGLWLRRLRGAQNKGSNATFVSSRYVLRRVGRDDAGSLWTLEMRDRHTPASGPRVLPR